MNRKSFLRNAMMAVAVSLVPKILQPFIPEVVDESYCKGLLWHIQNDCVAYQYTRGTFTLQDLETLIEQPKIF